jgi:type I restriction enzyme R subunit
MHHRDPWATSDTSAAHITATGTLGENAPGRTHLISDIAKWFYQVVSAENEQE